jgi:hypothetical protein
VAEEVAEIPTEGSLTVLALDEKTFGTPRYRSENPSSFLRPHLKIFH